MAAFTFTTTSLTSVQGGTSTTLTNSAWTAQSVNSVFTTNTGGCTATVGVTTGTPTANAYVNVGGAGGACAENDFAEEIIYTAPSVPTGSAVLTDTFTIYSDSSVFNGQATLTVTVTEAGTSYSPTLNVFVDYGSAVPPSSITSLDVIVNGQF